MASTTLDFPLPFGPTTTVTPGSRSSVVESANDLKPLSVRLFRNIEDDADEDTSIVFNVKNKGLVVISGCSHAGVNTSLLYAKAMAGKDDIYCYYGGFHPNSDVDATGRDLLAQNIRYIIPTHCSPWPLVNFLWQENRKSKKPFMLTKNHLAPVGHVYTFSSFYEDD